MKWEIIPVHFEGDVMRWRAVLFNDRKEIVKERQFSYRSHAEKYIEEQNESI